MMKNQLKQFLIAGAVLAVLAALFFGWHSWYYRPQTLANESGFLCCAGT